MGGKERTFTKPARVGSGLGLQVILEVAGSWMSKRTGRSWVGFLAEVTRSVPRRDNPPSLVPNNVFALRLPEPPR